MSGGRDFTVTIRGAGGRPPSNRSEQSSYGSSEPSDADNSSVTGVNVAPSALGSTSDKDYIFVPNDRDIGTSESASRPSPPIAHRTPHDSRPRRPSRRESSHQKHAVYPHRVRRPQYSPTESVESYDESEYGPGPPQPHPHGAYQWAPQAGGQGHRYPPGYPHQPPPPQPGYGQYGAPNVMGPPGQQIARLPSYNQNAQYGYAQFQQPPQQQAPPGQLSAYYAAAHGHPGMPAPMPPHIAHAMSPPIPHSMSSGLAPHMQQMQMGYASPDLVQHPTMGGAGYFPYQQAPPYGVPQVPQIMAPQPIYHVYQTTPSIQASAPSPAAGTPAPAATPPVPASSVAPAPPAEPVPPPVDTKYEELKQLMLQERADREKREADALQAEKDKAAKAAADKKIADDIAAATKKAAEEARAEAFTEAEEKAATEREEIAKKAAEDAVKAKAEADAALAAADAALAAATAPEEKKKPIKFKDAVGRKFNFPFHLCATWDGMKGLIEQAFQHVDVIGQHVQEGRYDLIGPGNEIILPAVWETVIEPDWAITMHMWPIPEPEPEADIPAAEVGKDGIVVIVPESSSHAAKEKSKKKPQKTGGWSLFGGPAKPTKPKAKAGSAKKSHVVEVPPPPPPAPPAPPH